MQTIESNTNIGAQSIDGVSYGQAHKTNVGLGLDDLLKLDAASLDQLYRNASVPSLSAVRGDLRGRMLSVLGPLRMPLSPLSALASSDWFPWRGKTFDPADEQHGFGINRVFTDRLKLFRFATSIGPSKAGPFDALQLDYDLPENPWFIRRIEDEIRELSPGLWLGQAYFRTRAAAHLVLFFGLAAR